MLDLLVEADLLVADVDETVTMLVSRIGLPEPSGRWRQTFPNWDYDAVFARVNRDLVQAPTVLEVIQPRASTGTPPSRRSFLPEIYSAQQHTTRRTHATVFGTSEFEAVVENLRRGGHRHRLDAPNGELPFERLWVGYDESEPGVYRPEADGGLRLELLPTAALGRPTSSVPTTRVDDAPTMQRIAARQFVVADVVATVRALEDNLGVGVGTIHDCEQMKGRFAVLGTQWPASANLEIVSVDAADPSSLGPAWIRIEVSDLAATAEDLTRRGTRHTLLAGCEHFPSRLRVDPGQLAGVEIEFAQAAETAL
jgi:hypothetical protein